MFEADWRTFDDTEVMAQRVASYVESLVRSAIAARGSATLALAGGKTPVPAFRELAEARLDWSDVTLLPTDDRLVPMDDDRSNVRAIAKAFLPTGARVIPIATEIPDYRLAGNSADARLQDLPWPLDLVWLGMGKDGHTASIFAGPDLQDALDAPRARRAIGVMPEPLPAEAPVARVTLTRAAILSARTLMITITGDEKRALLEQAITDGQSSKLPIGRVLAEAEQPIDIHWAP